jgi:hypothetical protein
MISSIRCANKVAFHMMGCMTLTSERKKEFVGGGLFRLYKEMLISI